MKPVTSCCDVAGGTGWLDQALIPRGGLLRKKFILLPGTRRSGIGARWNSLACTASKFLAFGPPLGGIWSPSHQLRACSDCPAQGSRGRHMGWLPNLQNNNGISDRSSVLSEDGKRCRWWKLPRTGEGKSLEASGCTWADWLISVLWLPCSKPNALKLLLASFLFSFWEDTKLGRERSLVQLWFRKRLSHRTGEYYSLREELVQTGPREIHPRFLKEGNSFIMHWKTFQIQEEAICFHTDHLTQGSQQAPVSKPEVSLQHGPQE